MISKWYNWFVIELPKLFNDLTIILFQPLSEWVLQNSFINEGGILASLIKPLLNFSLIEMMTVSYIGLIIFFKILNLVLAWIT